MQFQHPELNEYYTSLMAATWLVASQKSDPIFMLMAMVDRFKISEFDAGGELPKQGDSDWSPKSSELSEIIGHIISPEQRVGLCEWYKDADNMNSVAAAFRDWLEIMIGESLKPQQGMAHQPA